MVQYDSDNLFQRVNCSVYYKYIIVIRNKSNDD